MLRKKQISIISVILAVLMLLNIITPVLAVDTAQAASQSFIEAADYSLPDTAEAERPVLRDPPPPVYENGSILIYNYAQLLLIGTGSPVTELDALTDKVGSGDAVTDENDSAVVYGSDCQYVCRIFPCRDIRSGAYLRTLRAVFPVRCQTVPLFTMRTAILYIFSSPISLL